MPPLVGMNFVSKFYSFPLSPTYTTPRPLACQYFFCPGVDFFSRTRSGPENQRPSPKGIDMLPAGE